MEVLHNMLDQVEQQRLNKMVTEKPNGSAAGPRSVYFSVGRVGEAGDGKRGKLLQAELCLNEL